MPRMPEPNTEPDTRKPYSRPEVVELGDIDDNTTTSVGTPPAVASDARGRDIDHLRPGAGRPGRPATWVSLQAPSIDSLLLQPSATRRRWRRFVLGEGLRLV